MKCRGATKRFDCLDYLTILSVFNEPYGEATKHFAYLDLEKYFINCILSNIVADLISDALSLPLNSSTV